MQKSNGHNNGAQEVLPSEKRKVTGRARKSQEGRKSHNKQLLLKQYFMEKFIQKKSSELEDLKKELEKEKKVAKEQEDKILSMQNPEEVVRSRLNKKLENHSHQGKKFTASCGQLNGAPVKD